MLRCKTDVKDFGVLVDKKVSETTWCEKIVRKSNAISDCDNVIYTISPQRRWQASPLYLGLTTLESVFRFGDFSLKRCQTNWERAQGREET